MTEKSVEQSLLSEMRAAIQGDRERASKRQTEEARSDPSETHPSSQPAPSTETAPARRGLLDLLLRRN